MISTMQRNSPSLSPDSHHQPSLFLRKRYVLTKISLSLTDISLSLSPLSLSPLSLTKILLTVDHTLSLSLLSIIGISLSFKSLSLSHRNLSSLRLWLRRGRRVCRRRLPEIGASKALPVCPRRTLSRRRYSRRSSSYLAISEAPAVCPRRTLGLRLLYASGVEGFESQAQLVIMFALCVLMSFSLVSSASRDDNPSRLVAAIKQLDRNGLQGNREFLVEVLMLSLIHHHNLVNLIGYYADGDQRLLVYEFMSLGSLEDHLLGHVASRVMGTYGYCAPEYARTCQLTLKSDVYSFGVVLLELITGHRAIDTAKPNDEQNLVSWAKLQRRRQELTHTTPDQLVDDEAMYYKVAGVCSKGRVYSLRSLGRNKRRYVNPDASTSQVLAQRGIDNFMILSTPKEMLEGVQAMEQVLLLFLVLEVLEN
ncbi:hypothetical protein Syun_007213 [Stephania yunnanensis]|uniref:Serine-threonine/tyrosine-protein kinase catalytic domain-containing protein n=1 Tax=Stephania yunnanensis TaxID=152371 RepID=A0AAP0KY19_9MAGN